MTRRRLRQFESLAAEIIEEGERLEAMRRTDERRAETLGCYSLTDDPEAETRRRAAELQRKRERFTRELRAVERWIDRITDSQTRRAIRLHYIEGMSWQAVASRMGYAGESGARMAAERYLNK